MAGDGAEASSSLPNFNLHPVKCENAKMGTWIDRRAVVSSSLPICLLLRESRVSGFASKGPALPGRPATERKKSLRSFPFAATSIVFFFFDVQSSSFPPIRHLTSF